MGACGPSKQMTIAHYRTEMMPIAKELSAKPRELNNGDTFVPVNYLTGEYSAVYPQWLTYDISPGLYSDMIQQLNKLSTASPVFGYKKYAKLSAVKAKVSKQNDRSELNHQTHALLLNLNTHALNPLGLNAISKLNSVEPSGMGIIIKKIHLHVDISHDTVDELIILPAYEYDNPSYSLSI